MPKKLVIVESPSKARSIAHYLGAGYAVLASVGHVRDLPVKELGVDIAADFQPTYVTDAKKRKVVDEIAEAARSAEAVFLATDPDREGEAIAWHVQEAAGLNPARTRRISFNQVTPEAVRQALAAPRDLDRDLIAAQEARRVLDRLVGYQISPLLGRAMHNWRLSAGRVQSVALRLVVEREREILAFVPEEYWTLDALLQRRTTAQERFTARLLKVRGEEPGLRSKGQVDAILRELEGADYVVTRVQPGKRQRKPQPPFITSTMQAEAGSKLGFNSRRTMRFAQQLYEGIELGGEIVGLITYMRTDSTHVAPEAQQEARDYVIERWGAEYAPAKPPVYQSKVANAQEAHEAIRPTAVARTPQEIKRFLSSEQARLYELIWRRFVASQMQPARYDTLTVDVTANHDYLFRATGQTLVFPGFLAAYPDESGEEAEQQLPSLVKGEPVDLVELQPTQHFTKPPPRYTEPTLIKALEANGVGRPSTYAAIVSVIQERGYVAVQGRALQPTELGFVVCDALVATFPDIMDVGYTAQMETQLDRIAAGEVDYRGMMTAFYGPFSAQLATAKSGMAPAVAAALTAGLSPELLARTCPQCGRPLVARLSKAGRFLGCSGYPDCAYILQTTGEELQPQEVVYAEGEVCTKCGGRMRIITRGQNSFMGCEHYPKCKHTRPILSGRIIELARTTACPTCGAQPLEPRSGRFGEYLYCPTCNKNISLAKLNQGDKIDTPCPTCGAKDLQTVRGRYGPYYRCGACGANISQKKLAAGQA
jgi:DNA topoisomerase-1